MPNILIISEVFYPEETLITDIALSWHSSTNLIEILTRTPSYPVGRTYSGYKNRLFQRNNYQGIIVNRVGIIQGYRESKFIKVLNYIWNMMLASSWIMFNQSRFDAIFIHHTGPLTFAVPGKLANLFFRKHTAIWTMDVWPDSVYAYGFAQKKLSSSILERFVKWTYKGMNKVAVTSPAFIESVSKYTNEDVTYIPQWSRTSTSEYIALNLTGQCKFVFTGNISKAQGLSQVLIGFSKYIKDFNHNSHFHIVGDGSNLDDIKILVKSLNLDNNVTFWGRRPLSEMASFFREATFLVLSLENHRTFNNTIPAKFQSYLASAKPMFTITGGIVNNIVRDNDLGYYSDSDSIEEIANGFNNCFLSSEKNNKRLGSNSLSYYNSNYNKNVILEKLLRMTQP